MKPRILFLFDELCLGGAQRHAIALMQSLDAEFELVIAGCAATVSNELIVPGFEDRVIGLGIIGFSRPSKWLELGRRLREFDADLIIGVNQFAGTLVGALKLISGLKAPYALSFHSTIVETAVGWSRTLPFFVSAWAASSFIYVSKNQAAMWTKRGLISRDTKTIVNGIDISQFPLSNAVDRARVRAEVGLSETDYVVGLCGAFRAEKNQAQLVRALAALKGRSIPTKALFVGDGPMRSQVENLSRDLGVEDRAFFVGSKKDVRPYLAAMDVGVLTSTTETLSLAALEMMSCGVPMVLSNVGGASEIVEDGLSGFLFPAGNDAALVDRLENLANAEIRSNFAHRARGRVIEFFDATEMNRSYAEFFREMARPNGKEQEV